MNEVEHYILNALYLESRVSRTHLLSVFPTLNVDEVIWRLVEHGMIRYDGNSWDRLLPGRNFIKN